VTLITDGQAPGKFSSSQIRLKQSGNRITLEPNGGAVMFVHN